MPLSTIARLAGSIAEWAGSAVIAELVSTGFSYLGNRKLPANGVAELKRIETALPQIKDAMSIAEALKMKDPSFCEWVEKFRLAVEASEDVLDELEYKKLEDTVKGRDEAGGSASSSNKRKSCTINDDTLERLKEAVTMLDEAANSVGNLLQAANQFGIQNLSESQQEASKVFSRETTSFLVERELFGREVEKHKIIDWLKRPTDARLSSFSIVGVGGLGKTTLVQYAYQEMHGSNHFDKTIWVCVSTNFSVEDITRKILGELGENNCNNKPLNALQETLKENIHLKKILLVLDDIWDDEKRSDWDQLIAPLRFLQEGSRILFTTRMESVANLLKSVISTEHESLSLQGLGEQELRSLFQSYAFRGFNLDNHGDLQAIGDQILKMLRGSPLAAKVIGSLLNSRMDYQYWRRVLDQGSLFNLEQAKDVVEVLKLSYYHLPANLQVCFRFCSIFPQDHQFDKDDLIKMWICSGFIRQQSNQEERPEDIGEDYFNLLLRKSFFEPWKGESWKGERRYVMHDLVHELAQNVSYGECCRIEPNDKSITIPTSTVRHVYVHAHELEKVSHLENLRSLVITSYWNSFVLPNNLIKKSLRLLKICRWGNCEMPKEISYLVHLRYLSVGGTQPYYVIDETFKYLLLSSVYKLYHLQVLEIPGYNNVAINSAIETTGVTNLRRLRYMRLPKEIMQTIHGVHKLTSLQELTFFVGQETGQRINELGTLKNLRHLFIENIEKIGDYTEAQSANLFGKNNLMSLSLKWTSESNPIHPEKIMDYLQPPSSLMELTINNYSGERYPKWMEGSPPLNLSSLKLHNCPLWKNQSFFGKIPCLKILDIRYCLNLDKLPDMPLSLIEFRISNVGLTSLPALCQNFGNNTPASLSLKSSLRVVEIARCPNLISLHGFLQQDNLDLQAIEKLSINNSEKLVHLPTHGFGKLTSLKYLKIQSCQNLEDRDCPTSLPLSLIEFRISNVGLTSLPALCQNFGNNTPASLSLKSSLRVVEIARCPNLISLHGFLQQDNLDLQAIEKLSINNCEKLVHLPTHGFGKLTSLKYLKIQSCQNLEDRDCPTSLPLSLIEFRISNVGLTSLPALCQNFGNNTPASLSLKSSLRVVEIARCPNLISLHGFLQQDNLDLQAIEELTIDGCERLVHLPTHGFGKLTSLKYLTIQSCQNLENRDCPTLLPLSLIEFRICEVGLTYLPTLYQNSGNNTPAPLSLKSSLRVVQIKKCPNLISLHGFLQQDNLDLQAIERLTINGCERLVHLPTHGFGKLTSLKYLKIQSCQNLEDRDCPTSLPLSLIEFRISNVGLTSLPALCQNFGNNTPASLSLKSSLRVVQIEKCPDLISLHGFLQQDNLDLQAIEELTIDGCERLVHLPTHGFGKLTSLKYLTIQSCQNLKNRDCPTLLPLSLIEFRICEVGLTYLPTLYQNSGNNTPAPLSLKSSLRVVQIKKCPNLISLHGFLQQDNLDLQAIERLTINGCERLVHLPTHGFGKLTSLKYLKIESCQNLENRDCPTLLPLSLIEFRICEVGLSALPEYYQSSDSSSGPSTSSLKTVWIENCQNLRSLNGFLQQDNIDFQSIEKIEVRSCKNLVHLPMGAFGKFVSLQKLIIWNCPMLMAVDNQSTLLPMALKYLFIEDCGKVDEPLLESASSLPTLTDLCITDCANISRIPSSENAFRSLNDLFISKCKKLVEHSSTEQAHGVDQGSSLASLKIKTLYIDNLSLLLIEPLRSLSFVSELSVSNCSGMETSLEQWFLQNSSTLKRLVLSYVRNLNKLSATMVRLTVLEDLRIYGADLLEELPELPASLRQLHIDGASSLKSLPATMARLTALEKLEILDADLLEELPELPASLRSLCICDASSLKSLPATMARLTALESLEIWNAGLLEELPELPASLKKKRIEGRGGRLL